MEKLDSPRPEYIYTVDSNIKSPCNWSLQTKRYWPVKIAEEIEAIQNILYLNNNTKENRLLHFHGKNCYTNATQCYVTCTLPLPCFLPLSFQLQEGQKKCMGTHLFLKHHVCNKVKVRTIQSTCTIFCHSLATAQNYAHFLLSSERFSYFPFTCLTPNT